MIHTLLLRPSLHFTTLHFFPFKTSPSYTSLNFTSSHLNFTQLNFTTLSFDLTPFKFPIAQFHLTSLHFTSLHFTAHLDDFRHTSIISPSPRLLLLSSLSIVLGLQRKVPNASAGSWFQFFLRNV